MTATTMRTRIDTGRLPSTTNDRGHRAVRTEDLRPLVEARGRTYGPASAIAADTSQ